MTAPKTLLATEFTKAAGVSYRQLDYWTRRGVVRVDHPADARPDDVGSGFHRRYLATDVPVVRLMGQIQSAGLSDVETVRWLAEELLSTGSAEAGPIRVTLTGGA